SYPWYTPYQFAGNTPIMAVDLDGLEPITAFPEYLQPLIRGHVIVVTNTSDDVELTIALSRQGIMRNGQYTINPNPLGSSFTMIEYQSFSLQNNGYLSSHAFLGPIIQRIPIPVIPPIATLSPPLLNTSSGVDLNLQDFMLPKPDEPVNEITFRGEPILPDKPFSFSELIATGLYNPAIRNIEEAKDQIRDLAEFLNENKDASVLILGNFHLNKGGTVKPWETTYSEIIKKKEGIPEHINTFEEFAVERAKNVERLLINEFGVDPKQLRIGTGNQYKDAQRGQSVSFELKRKKK
ncbi:MAG TPA: hypothetical protein PKC58_17100, partial [Ignavibacteria bacterium]|nr:hypothetical protein [Ignavibacteria bacterium]